MNPGLSLQEIPLSEVPLDPGAHPFALVRDDEVDRLGQSLAEVGLLGPPRLLALPEGRFQPVTGWRRLLAAARLGWPTIPAIILAPETPKARLLLLYLHDNAFTRRFNPLEQALLASRFLRYWDRDALVAKLLPLLGLPPSLAHLQRLLAAATLERPWLELLAQERLALTAAARLAAWEPADRTKAWPFLATLPFSQSKQEGFLESVEILARRQGASPTLILQGPELQRLLADTALNPVERAEALRRLLDDRLSPRYSAARRAFTAGLARLGLHRHPRLRLTPPPAFEGPDFELSLKFIDVRELRQHFRDLSRLVQLPDFEALVTLGKR
ncbi:MAG: ParB/RepB/Spo0J family partition protein [Desulfobaccales bacterium]